MKTKAAFSRGEFAELAEFINTGSQDPDTSRALVVFNTSAEPISGFVLFQVDMPWRFERPLPPLSIHHFVTGRPCWRAVQNLRFVEAREIDRRERLIFDLIFEARDVPPRGWDTYIAAYALSAAPNSNSDIDSDRVDQSRYRLVETLRHGGELPPRWEDSE